METQIQNNIFEQERVKITDPKLSSEQAHKYLSIFGILWVCFLLLTTFTSLKTFLVFGFEFNAAVIAYPMTYIFADIFTEVYGYRVTRKVIWSGFVGTFLVSMVAYLYTIIPPSPLFQFEEAFDIVFQTSPILVLILITGYLVGEFSNSFTLAKLKIFTAGKYEEVRYVLSTLVGQTFDNLTFFSGAALILSMFTPVQVVPLIITSTIFCVLVEIIMIPITKRVIKWIKEQEGIDTYDHGTNFNPFKIM